MPSYECDGCGACCRTFPIFASEEDAAREPRVASEGRKLPAQLADDEWHYRLYPLPFLEACTFLDGDQRCTIYETRPGVCRQFAAGEAQCQRAREREGLAPLEAGQRPVPGVGSAARPPGADAPGY